MQPLLKMFGCREGDVEGKNINVLMRNPFHKSPLNLAFAPQAALLAVWAVCLPPLLKMFGT
jgi:hypothetical protein